MAPGSLCQEIDMRCEKNAMLQRHCGLVLDDTTRLKPAGGRSTLSPKFVRSHVRSSERCRVASEDRGSAWEKLRALLLPDSME